MSVGGGVKANLEKVYILYIFFCRSSPMCLKGTFIISLVEIHIPPIINFSSTGILLRLETGKKSVEVAVCGFSGTANYKDLPSNFQKPS